MNTVAIKKMIYKSMKAKQASYYKMKMSHRFSISHLKVYFLHTRIQFHQCNGAFLIKSMKILPYNNIVCFQVLSISLYLSGRMMRVDCGKQIQLLELWLEISMLFMELNSWRMISLFQHILIMERCIDGIKSKIKILSHTSGLHSLQLKGISVKLLILIGINMNLVQ